MARLHMPREISATAVERRPVLWAAALVLTGATTCAVGCGPTSSGTAQTLQPLEILVSADTAGWIVPCGCATNQSGGLPRRAALVAEARRRGETLVLDAGGAASGTSRYDRLKFAAILQGELAMGIAAHNIGASEAELDVHELRRLARELKAPLISTNLTDQDGVPFAETVVVRQFAGRRTAVLGVNSPALTPSHLRAVPPHDAVLQALAGLVQKPELVVVLAYLPEAELEAFAASLPEVDVVIGGPTGQSLPPRKFGPTTLVAVTNKGKFIADLRYPADHVAAPAVEIVELAERFADEPGQTANVRAFYEELGRLDISATETAFAAGTIDGDLATSHFAGSEACRTCHADDHRLWQTSAHAHAWQTLVARKAQFDSYCQHCHTTGFGRPAGFLSVRQSLHRVDVGCESCHGPSTAHVADPKTTTGFGSAAKDQCRSCHDRENSPNFEYAGYWKEIAHGSGEAEPAANAPRRLGEGS